MYKPHPKQIAFLKSKTPPVLYGGALPTRTGAGFDPRVLHFKNGSMIEFKGAAADADAAAYQGSEYAWWQFDDEA